jgi:hypothetical protein
MKKSIILLMAVAKINYSIYNTKRRVKFLDFYLNIKTI